MIKNSGNGKATRLRG